MSDNLQDVSSSHSQLEHEPLKTKSRLPRKSDLQNLGERESEREIDKIDMI